ncbi:hypothetical protein [Glaciimonas sp. PAMC28666]|uniref:hypothetical protein n=1 Tax=Glaciimonas sp. PAMC28666 TaxID=2807626 RepID=UPI0019661B68|nr:hypothetical protein [Glaciimonas sp. PAMC28666]QRX83749.1 hypothetical protein JQN73_05845 [Glaciimonas sp. PAMC28666]
MTNIEYQLRHFSGVAECAATSINWLIFQAAFPASGARCIAMAMLEGQLHVRDMLIGVEDSGTDFRLRFGSEARVYEKVDYLIDARGAGYNEGALRRVPLICHLLDQDAVAHHILGGTMA